MNSDGKASSGGDFVPPRAELWNNMIDAGNAWRNGRLNSPAPQPTRARGTDLLKLKNSSAANRRKGEILKIDGKVIETITDEHIWLDGVEPTNDCRFGILKYPADDGEVQTCQVSGVCLAMVNVTDADHQFAVAVDGEYVLQSATSGPIELLFVPDLPEEEEYPFELECVVRFGQVQGGETQIINFQVVSSDPTTRSALVQIEQRAFRGQVYGSILNDEVVYVYDTRGCYLNKRNEDLTGRFGSAVLMYTDDAAAELHFSEQYEPPERYWCVQDLCCPNIVCED